MTSLLLILNLLNEDLEGSLLLFLLLPILSMRLLLTSLSLIFALNILIIKSISLLTTCSVITLLLFFFFLFVSVNNGIPLWFRCFKGQYNPDAFSLTLIKSGISFCFNLFSKKNSHIIFLADRWFAKIDLISYIQSIGAFYCFRTRSDCVFSYTHSSSKKSLLHLYDIRPLKYSSKVVSNVFYTKNLFKTNIVVSNYSNTDEPWYLVTNDDTSRAIRNYSYRFGSIECIFKSQKSNGFRLESTKTRKIEHFISLFTIMCVALLWLTIIGVDYSKNKHHYNLGIRDVHKSRNGTYSRLFSFFNLGLTIFNRCYYNFVDFRLKFDFVLYDI